MIQRRTSSALHGNLHFASDGRYQFRRRPIRKTNQSSSAFIMSKTITTTPFTRCGENLYNFIIFNFKQVFVNTTNTFTKTWKNYTTKSQKFSRGASPPEPPFQKPLTPPYPLTDCKKFAVLNCKNSSRGDLESKTNIMIPCQSWSTDVELVKIGTKHIFFNRTQKVLESMDIHLFLEQKIN